MSGRGGLIMILNIAKYFDFNNFFCEFRIFHAQKGTNENFPNNIFFCVLEKCENIVKSEKSYETS